MSWDLFVDSDNVVSFEPEYDFRFEDRKMQDEHRVRSGARFVYRWGGYRRWTFSARFISSADMAAVNSWWDSNTQLLFRDTSAAAVFSVQIVNSRLPIDSFIKPYLTEYQGRMEIEVY